MSRSLLILMSERKYRGFVTVVFTVQCYLICASVYFVYFNSIYCIYMPYCMLLSA